MKGFYRIAVATPRLHLGNPEANLDEHVRLAQEASGKGVSVLAFPELSITGYSRNTASSINVGRSPM